MRWFREFEGAGLDGLIAKDPAASYQPGKRVLTKLKHERTADCVVAGYRTHKTDDEAIGSLLLEWDVVDHDFIEQHTVGFEEYAGWALSDPNLTFVDLESIPGCFATPLDRMSLERLPPEGAWLRPLRPALRRRLSRRIYDFVQFEFPWFVNLYPAVREPTRIIYSAHNIESDWWAPRLAGYPFSGWWRRRL